MHPLEELASGHSLIYIVSRIFDFAEKMKAEDLSRAVERGIMRAMHEVGIVTNPSAAITFVPFRDTVQKKAANGLDMPEVSLTQRIYFEDLERLDNLFALIGFFDGLSKDEGICMEIGYAFGINKPIVLALSDFIRAGYKNLPDSEHLVDPVIEAMSSKIIHEYRIPDVPSGFKKQLKKGLDNLFRRVEDEVYLLGLESIERKHQERPNEIQSSDVYDVYIDFGGGLFEWQRIFQDQLVEKLNTMSISCTTGTRYSHCDHQAITDTKTLGWQDINKAKVSTIVVTCSDSIEMNSGTAAIQGFARAIGKKIILYDSKATSILGDNNYVSSRNLMIDYSANQAVSKFDDILPVIEEFLSE